MIYADYLPSRTFGALRLICRAMVRQHQEVDVAFIADVARLTLSRDITSSHVCRAAQVAGLEITR